LELEQCASSGAGVSGAVGDPSVRVGALSAGAESITFGDPYVMEQWILLVSKPASVVGVEGEVLSFLLLEWIVPTVLRLWFYVYVGTGSPLVLEQRVMSVMEGKVISGMEQRAPSVLVP
jgi:hypothetical protein